MVVVVIVAIITLVAIAIIIISSSSSSSLHGIVLMLPFFHVQTNLQWHHVLHGRREFVLPDGLYRFRVRAIDSAGNVQVRHHHRPDLSPSLRGCRGCVQALTLSTTPSLPPSSNACPCRHAIITTVTSNVVVFTYCC